MVIVDTSVAIKWFVSEEDSDRAIHLARDEEMAAPDLFLYEVCNVLSVSLRFPLKEVHEALEKLYKLPIQFFVLPSSGFRRTTEIATRFGITVYDASYLALAESLDSVLVTADKRFIRSVVSHPKIRDLKESI